MLSNAIVVLTEETRVDIFANGYTGDWKLNVGRAAKCKYVVCCSKGAQEGKGVRHGDAFLIGRIKAVIDAGDGRYNISVSEIADIGGECWPENLRNPVKYGLPNNVSIDLTQVTFEAIPMAGERLTVKAAKRGLAAFYGCDEELIEIKLPLLYE